MDKEDITFVQDEHPCGKDRNNFGRRRREVSHRNKRNAFLKSLINFGNGIVSVVDSVVVAGAGILGIESVNQPLLCQLMKLDGVDKDRVKTQNIGDQIKYRLPGFLLDENKELDLSKLTEALETQSLTSIREKLINVLGNVFAFLKELFRHTKKIFYVVTMCLMITDGYK